MDDASMPFPAGLVPLRAPILFTAPPGWRWRTRTGDHWNCWCAVAGAGRLRFAGHDVAIVPGTCALIPPHTEVAADHDARHPATNLAIHGVSAAAPAGPGPAPVVLPDPARLLRLAEDCIAAWAAGAADEYAALTLVLLARIRRAGLPAQPRADVRLERLLLAITRQPGLPWSVAACAAHIGLSRSQLVRRCRRAYAAAPAGLIARIRDEHALRLLRESDLPLHAIAAQSGHVDASHLGRRLRARLGHPPGRLRPGRTGPL
jgi:AraC-like DNA-binding protein